jgi:WD40 repeat protein
MAGPFPMPGPFPQPNPGTVTPTPRPAAPPALKARWTAPADVGTLTLKPELGPTFTRDGLVLLQHGGTSGLILAYDAADGTPLPGFAGHQGNETLGWLAPFADRVASSGKDGIVKVWMARTGAAAPDLIFPKLPISGKQSYGSYKAVSATGRYTAYGRQAMMSGTAGQYRVMDTTTGKDVVEGHWLCGSGSGHISFTPDELRVFVVNGTGKATWFKLPSGEKDAEWGGMRPQPTNRVASVSADGSRVVFDGKLNNSLGTNVVDGRTGEVVRPLNNPPYQPAVASLSPDGKLVAVPVQDLRDGVRWHVDVMDVASGKKVGRVSPAREFGNDVPMPRFAPDGKSLAVTFREGKQVAVYAIGTEGG